VNPDQDSRCRNSGIIRGNYVIPKMMLYLLDTNIISARINKNEMVVAKWDEANFSKGPHATSAVSYYEIKRGLLAVNATRKFRDFEAIRQNFQMLFLDGQEVFDKAVDIHVDLRRRGRPIPDADILIAATALTRNLILVPDDSHFQWVEDLTVENWLRE
jgi:tRNA(fMet)-specific endonuclease VapC